MIKNRYIFILAMLVAPACASALRGTATADEGIRFTYTAPAAASVAIAGEFNHWDPAKDRLRGPDEKGAWSISLRLSEGRYEYRFVVNGKEWELDPSAPSTDDGMGGRNSVVVVAP